MTVTLDAGAGQFASGQTSVTFSLGNTVRLPDWTSVERHGYRLSSWTDGDGASHAPGEALTDGTTYTAVWEAQTALPTDYLPRAQVIVIDSTGATRDVSALTGNSVKVHRAENRGGETTFTLHPLSADASDNPMSASFSGWSDGTARAVATAMYVWIGDIKADGFADRIGDGWISTLACREDGGVDVTVADGISVLSKQGTALRRNLRNTETANDAITISTSDAFDGDTANDTVTADVSTSSLGGLVFDPNRAVRWWYIEGDRTVEIGSDVPLPDEATSGVSRTIYPGDVYVQSVKVHLYMDKGSGNAHCRGTVTVTAGGVSASSDYSYDGSTMDDVISTDITLWLTGSDPRGAYAKNGVQIAVTNLSSFGTGSTLQHMSSGVTVRVVKYKEAVPDLSGTTLTSPSKGSYYAWVGIVQVYAYSDASITCASVIEWLARALSYVPDIMSGGNGGSVALYRIGGAYASAYMTDLADIPNSSTGRMLRYEAHGRYPVISVLPRAMTSDGTSVTCAYAGDGIAGQFIVSHSPSRTLSQRPNAITFKGSVSGSSGNVPVTLTVKDYTSVTARGGLVIEQTSQDSSISSIRDGMVSAYATLTSKSLDQWEGSLSIPWSAQVLEGAVARIEDSRYGIDVTAKVTEATYDYSACTVTLEYGNYDVRYASSLSDVADCAVTASVTASSSGDWNQQYVFLETDTALTDVNFHILALTDSGTVTTDVTSYTSIYAMPKGGHIAVINYTFLDSTGSPSTVSYGLWAVTVGSSTLTIPEILRTDAYSGQTVTVCIQSTA